MTNEARMAIIEREREHLRTQERLHELMVQLRHKCLQLRFALALIMSTMISFMYIVAYIMLTQTEGSSDLVITKWFYIVWVILLLFGLIPFFMSQGAVIKYMDDWFPGFYERWLAEYEVLQPPKEEDPDLEE